MNLKGFSLFLSSALLTAGIAFAPAAQAQGESTIIMTGGSPYIVYVDSNGMHDMNNMGTMGSTAVTPGGPVDVEGVASDWVPSSDVPVFSGVVVDQDPVGQTAIVRSQYGYVSVPTSAGARVLYNGRMASWLTVPPGAVVQLPLTFLISGPVPHRIRINASSMGMSTGMGNMGTMNNNGAGGNH